MELIKKSLNSRKFWASVAGIVIVFLSESLGMSEADATAIVTIIGGYLVGQGLAVFGKEAK